MVGLASRVRDLAEATPATRDRVVDAVRAAAISVVILWHWVGSLTHRGLDGTVVMPNPIDEVPGGWLATWVLNVVPLFFVVGGFANLAAWDASRADTAAFLRRRLSRLLAPVAVWVTLWLAVELVAALVAAAGSGRHRWLWQWFPGVLTPLWFVLAYVGVTVAVPLTARWHRRHGTRALAVLAGAVVLGDVLARGWGLSVVGWVSGALVWVAVHQLGYVWRDRGEGFGARTRAATAVTGLGALLVLTGLLGYPRSMVAVQGQGESNLWPPNATVLALAVFQLGLVWLLAPAAAALLRRRRVWQPVVAVNAAALTLFVWHMTAYAAVFWLTERIGLAPGGRPTSDWVVARPLWLLAPGLVLALLVAIFVRFERR